MEANPNKHGLTVRGDSLYCPLPLSIEPYWWCEPDCFHCYFRGLNHVWGKDLRPLNVEALDRKLASGKMNATPKSPLAHCLARKVTIRVGNKSDPFQPAERQYLRTTPALRILRKHKWSFVIQTRFIPTMMDLALDSLVKSHKLGLVTIMPIISPGMEKDWEVFERCRTATIPERLEGIRSLINLGIPVGVNGEPFIPGFHEIQDFRNTLKALKSVGVRRYNTYNFHFTPYVAKRIARLPGVDIEKIWELNQDRHWKKILPQLVEEADRQGFTLGCPDFVNTGPMRKEPANTCCGVDVPVPTTYNTHYFKKWAQEGKTAKQIETLTWDGSGDREQGLEIIKGTNRKMFTLKDAGVI